MFGLHLCTIIYSVLCLMCSPCLSDFSFKFVLISSDIIDGICLEHRFWLLHGTYYINLKIGSLNATVSNKIEFHRALTLSSPAVLRTSLTSGTPVEFPLLMAHRSPVTFHGVWL